MCESQQDDADRENELATQEMDVVDEMASRVAGPSVRRQRNGPRERSSAADPPAPKIPKFRDLIGPRGRPTLPDADATKNNPPFKVGSV